MKNLIFFFLCVTCLWACSDKDIDEPLHEKAPFVHDELESLMIDREPKSISSTEAGNIANIFRYRDSSEKSRSLSSFGMNVDIEIITENTITPLLYIINWGKNDGFAIISASKNTSPILAYSESGHYNIDCRNASNMFIEAYKDMVSGVISDNSDSLRMQHAAEWAMFEKNDTNNLYSRASDSEIESMIQNEISRMTAKGYRYVGKLDAVKNFLPADEFYALTMDVKTHSDQKYNYEEVSLFFLKNDNIEVYGPLIGTQWNQTTLPFSEAASNGIAGCATIAIGQIAYYHKYPTQYDWNSMPMYSTGYSNSAVKKLIGDILSYASPDYNSNSTGISYSNSKKAFQKLGFTATEGIPSFDGLRDHIKAKSPVFISGKNDEGTGHAWVCEGYQRRRWEGVISMIGDMHASLTDHEYDPSVSPYMHYGFLPRPPQDIVSGTPEYMYYMNFGWGGTSNGWYNYNSFGGYNSNANYHKDQKTLFVSIPR